MEYIIETDSELLEAQLWAYFRGRDQKILLHVWDEFGSKQEVDMFAYGMEQGLAATTGLYVTTYQFDN